MNMKGHSDLVGQKQKIIDLPLVKAAIFSPSFLTEFKSPEHKAEQHKLIHLLLIVTRINQE